MSKYQYYLTLLTSFQKYMTTLNFFNALYIIKANTLELNSFKNHIRQPNELKKTVGPNCWKEPNVKTHLYFFAFSSPSLFFTPPNTILKGKMI